MKSKVYKIGISAVVAVLTIAVIASFGAHQMAQAQGGVFMHHGMGKGFVGKMMSGIPEIEGTVPLRDSIRENMDSVKIGTLDAGVIAAKSIEDGTVLRGGIIPVQGYLVYHYAVVSLADDQLYRVIVDAGNGEILHTSDGISLEKLDAKISKMKEKFGKK